jgi:hypothetical protein
MSTQLELEMDQNFLKEYHKQFLIIKDELPKQFNANKKRRINPKDTKLYNDLFLEVSLLSHFEEQFNCPDIPHRKVYYKTINDLLELSRKYFPQLVLLGIDPNELNALAEQIDSEKRLPFKPLNLVHGFSTKTLSNFVSLIKDTARLDALTRKWWQEENLILNYNYELVPGAIDIQYDIIGESFIYTFEKDGFYPRYKPNYIIFKIPITWEIEYIEKEIEKKVLQVYRDVRSKQIPQKSEKYFPNNYTEIINYYVRFRVLSDLKEHRDAKEKDDRKILMEGRQRKIKKRHSYASYKTAEHFNFKFSEETIRTIIKHPKIKDKVKHDIKSLREWIERAMANMK